MSPRTPPRSQCLLGALVALLASASCLDVADVASSRPTCQNNWDCNQEVGEVCEEEVCWGMLPPGQYFALIGPPGRSDSNVPLEAAVTHSLEAGWLPDFRLPKPRKVTGHVLYDCAPAQTCANAIDVTMTISRPSSFTGGPGYSDLQQLNGPANPGAPFSLFLPPVTSSLEGAPLAYVVTVTPNTTTAAATVVPPLRLTLAPENTNAYTPLVLGGATHLRRRGLVRRAQGGALAGYRVFARGRWQGDATESIVSNIAISDATGAFELTLANDIEAEIEIVAAPQLGGELTVVSSTTISATANVVLEVPEHSAPLPRRISVRGPDAADVAIPGAKVTARYRSAGAAYVEVTVTGTTGINGTVDLQVINTVANQVITYDLQVVPGANAEHQAKAGVALLVGPAEVRLPSRVPLEGLVRSPEGLPLHPAVVNLRPAQEYLVELSETERELVAASGVASAITGNDGRFVLRTDPPLRANAAYELEVLPSQLWLPKALFKLTLNPDQSALPQEFVVPSAAMLRARVLDVNGIPLEGAQLRLFRPGTTLCTTGPACVKPAWELAQSIGQDGGIMNLAVPR